MCRSVAAFGSAMCLFLAAPETALGQRTALLGVELTVNSYTLEDQFFGDIASDGDGDFVVTWSSVGQDGSSFGVFARRFNVVGAPQGIELQVNTYTLGPQGLSAIAMDGQGEFVVVWSSAGQDGDSNGLFARRFSSDGSPLAAELQVSSFTSGNQRDPGVAMNAGGAFVVTWSSDGQNGVSYGVFGRLFDSQGEAQALEFQVGPLTSAANQRQPSVAMGDDGAFVVAWQTDFGGDFDIRARRFDASGSAVGFELPVNAATGDQSGADVALDDDGDFLVTWTSYGQDGLEEGVFARCFDSTGSAVTGELQINSFTLGTQTDSRIGRNQDGSFLIVWRGRGEGSVANQVFAQTSPVHCHDRGQLSVGAGTVPNVTLGGGGDFVVAWTGSDADGSGMSARRLGIGASSSLDIDGNGKREPLTDGLLVLRFLFGFTGSTLVTGAVAADCSRCEAAEIESYLESL